MGHRASKETNVLLDFLKNGTVQSRKGESVISRQGTKAAYHCFVSRTADNGEWRNGSEKDTDGEGVKNTVWL